MIAVLTAVVLFLLSLAYLTSKKLLKLLGGTLICIICFIVCQWVIVLLFLPVFLCMEILAASLLTLWTLSILSILLSRLSDSCLWKKGLRLITIFVHGLLLVYLALRLAALPFLILILILNL